MATKNVVRTVVGNSPTAADSANGAGAGAEAAIATPMLETATAATKVLVQADLMAEAIFEFEGWNYYQLVWRIWFEAITVWDLRTTLTRNRLQEAKTLEGNDGFYGPLEHDLYGSQFPFRVA
ncbi:hypothetical protein R1sor_022759 [Riccia sorocarpa]|uniref:Uncharacterized protein n=1 Tax=Riccia sorocarpa TaxID=122646 RepID=A0ABD3GKT8_9MARC